MTTSASNTAGEIDVALPLCPLTKFDQVLPDVWLSLRLHEQGNMSLALISVSSCIDVPEVTRRQTG